MVLTVDEASVTNEQQRRRRRVVNLSETTFTVHSNAREKRHNTRNNREYFFSGYFVSSIPYL